MSVQRTSEPATRAAEQVIEDALGHRRRTARDVRHTSKARLHELAGDDELMEDADLICPQPSHDLGRKTSPPRKGEPKPGRRSGFKVWKTPFWKRRRTLWAERNAAERRILEEG
ncbi:MAG TPA: hypothetical protein VNF71_07630 [Acidimicrobiales bacterium]|nr:hypothetical protein [Acidimicrobiales bacterium]